MSVNLLQLRHVSNKKNTLAELIGKQRRHSHADWKKQSGVHSEDCFWYIQLSVPL